MAYVYVEGSDQVASEPGVQTEGSRAVLDWQSEDYQNHPERRNVQKQKDVADFGAIDILVECHRLFHNHGIFLSILLRQILVDVLLGLPFGLPFLFSITFTTDFHIRAYLRDDAPSNTLTELSVRAAIYGFLVMLPITWTSGPASSSPIIYSVWRISAGLSVTYADALAAMRVARSRVMSALSIHCLCICLICIMMIVHDVILTVLSHVNISSALATTLLFIVPVCSVGAYTAWTVFAFKFQLAASVATLEDHEDSARHVGEKDCEKAWELLQGKSWVAFRIQIILFFIVFVPYCMSIVWLSSHSWRGPITLTVLRLLTVAVSLTFLRTIYNLVGALLYVSCKAYHEEISSSNLRTGDSYAALSPSPEEVSEEP